MVTCRLGLKCFHLPASLCSPNPIAGSWGFEPRHVDRALRLLERAKYRELFERQVTHRFTLDKANEAPETVRRLQSGNALIVPGAE